MAEQSDFSQILCSLLAIDNTVRQAAEVSPNNNTGGKTHRQ